MILSRILMVLALAVLAYLVYITMNGTTPTTAPPVVTTTAPPVVTTTTAPPVAPTTTTGESFGNIRYETLDNVSGVADPVFNAAPFGANQDVNGGNYATVKFSGLVDAQPGDALQIEGTDLLTAPLVDNMLYTNSIANVNRNASQDLRGDIPLQYDEKYTPFNASTIYGSPLSQRGMNIVSI